MNLFSILVTIIFVILGGGSTLFITAYMLIISIQKIYGKIKYGKSLYD